MNTILCVLLTTAGLLAIASGMKRDDRNVDSIVAHILGTFGVKRDDDAAKIPEMKFSVVDKDIHYVSNYAFAAMICLASSDKRPLQPDPSNATAAHDACRNSSTYPNGRPTRPTDYNETTSFREEISDLGVEEVKPIVIDKIDLSLGSGPIDYGVTFEEFAVDGFVNITVNQIRSNLDRSLRFNLTFVMRKLSVTASSGVLIMLPITGGGTYWVEFEEIAVEVYIVAIKVVRDSKTYLRLEHLEIDFSLEDVQMGLKNINNSNNVLESALNLFIDAYALEFLEQIKPHVRDKLAVVVESFVQNWFGRMPVDNSYSYCNAADSR